MDWKIFMTTFITVFFAELGDKTQLATLGISSSSENRLSVFLGSAIALSLASFFAVMLGDVVCKYLPAELLFKISGVSFFILGVYFIWKGFFVN
jgi:putative Ca2+/H+ antiporter (TMEM165/GDT1 family)